ncbi:redoxin domain-containing protein [Acetobacter tropicalis]|uniref:redoxin domain-containing protein n=1 Tax=Acetobacter tropicalis TaxID=104102 RepID=UPI0009D96555|nr:redoxin domain-containing protein [Acetobacter tropicalis]
MQAPLCLGDQAPLFSARSTEGDFSLDNFPGHWLFLLFCHEAFDAIATTEIVSLSGNIGLFSKKKCQPLIITGSSLFSNLAWLHSIHHHNTVEMDLPIIEDPTYEIFNAYQCHNYKKKNRSFFLIDSMNNIRWVCHYPSNVGLDIEEILRTLTALQHNDQNNTLSPADWHPGEPSIFHTVSDRKTMISMGEKWFYCLQ